MSKFAIQLRMGEKVPRQEMRETLKAAVKYLGDKTVDAIVFNLVGKPDKKGKVQVNYLEFPLAEK